MTIEPRVETALQYVDNINLAEEGEEEASATGIELAPGIYAAYNSDRFMGAIDYSLIGRVWDESEYDDVSHQLAANGRWTAIPELFYVEADAGYGDTVIDPRDGLNYGGLGIFGGANLTEQATASIRPTLRKQFNEIELQASYSYGRSWYLDEGKGQPATPSIGRVGNEDSQDQAANVSVGTDQDGRKVNGSLFYSWQKSEFDRSLPYQYERAGFDGAVQLAKSIAIVGDVGTETDLDENTTEGGLDSNFWSAGLRWTPDDRTSAEGRYGERFFGSSYSAEVQHRARLIEISASYSEAPEVETRRASLGSFEPGSLPPWIDPGTVNGFFTSSPYVATNARLRLSTTGSRTTLSLVGFDTERNYLSELIGDEKATGAALRLSRKLASNVSLDFDAAYSEYERLPSFIGVDIVNATQDYDAQFVLRGNQDFGARLTASLEAGYLTRSGDRNYDGWWVGLRGRWIPSLR